MTLNVTTPTLRRVGSRVHTDFLNGTVIRVIDPVAEGWREWPPLNPPRIPLLPPLLPLCHAYYRVQPDRTDLKPHIVRHDEL
jgi:hypothetical protein